MAKPSGTTKPSSKLANLQRRRADNHPDALWLRFKGANPHSHPTSRKVLSSYSNYLKGADPERWHTHVPQFAEVFYPSIYPGIDLVYHGNKGQLEYDFVVAPHASAKQIAFSLEGTEGLSRFRVNTDGDLIASLTTGQIVLHKPRVFQGQCLAGPPGNDSAPGLDCKSVPGGGFIIRRRVGTGTEVAFELPRYDHAQTLIIDPVIGFSTFLGGSVEDGVNGMALDTNGDIYLAGSTTSPDFPVTSGSFQQVLAGNLDAFVTKLSNDGSQIIYSTYLGGSNSDYGNGIALDSSNNLYIAGLTYSSDFPLVKPYQTRNTSGVGFVSKLSPDGSSLIYSTLLGGSLEGAITAIGLDKTTNEAVVTGYTYSTDFPTVNAFQPTHGADNGNTDAFLTKFSATGKTLIFSTYFGGNSDDGAQGIALDSNENIYLTGYAGSSDFPTTPGSYQPSCISVELACSFVSEFNSSGASLAYSTFLSNGSTSAIAVNAAGNAYVTGFTNESDFPVTPGAFQTVQGGGASSDAFVTEFDPTGSSLVYSTYLGGNNFEYGYAITLDSSNDAYVTGTTYSGNFPLQFPVQATYGGVPSVFVSEFNSTGSELLFSTYLGGGAAGYGGQQGNAIAVDNSGNIYAAGSTSTPDFPVVQPLQATLKGAQNAFVAKFLTTAAPAISLNPSNLTFPPEVVGGTSAQQPVTVTNVGSAALNVSAVSAVGAFSEINGCSSAIAPQASCTIQVTFAPTVFGSNSGRLSISSNATILPEIAQLSGTGEDFGLVGSPGGATISAGQTATFSLTLAPEGGFNQNIRLSCSGAPSSAGCSVSPSSVTLDGTDNAPASVLVTTTAPSSSGSVVSDLRPNRKLSLRNAARRPSIMLLAMITLFPLSLVIQVSSRSKQRIIVIVMVISFLSFLVACGGGSSGGGGGGGTPPGSYSIVVTGTDASLSHSTQFTLTVK
ncbi:MAG: SBBP repeat-containing protein [Terriglobales bacterium]